MPRKPKCPEAAWHPVRLREPYGVDAGGWWCTECWGYVAEHPTATLRRSD